MDLQPSGCPLLIPGPSTEPATLEVVPTSRPNQLCWSELPSSPPFHTRAKRVELVPAVSCFAFHTGTLAVPGRPRRPSPGHRRSHWRLHPPPPTCFPLPPRLSASWASFHWLPSEDSKVPAQRHHAEDPWQHTPPPLLRTNAPFPRVSTTPSCLWLGGIEAPVCDF